MACVSSAGVLSSAVLPVVQRVWRLSGVRPLRVAGPGSFSHVTGRGNARQMVLLDDSDRYAFLALLARAVSRFELELLAYCLMGNHVHLLVGTPTGRLP